MTLQELIDVLQSIERKDKKVILSTDICQEMEIISITENNSSISIIGE